MSWRVVLPGALAGVLLVAGLFALRADAAQFGDADCNNTADSVDAALILQHSARLLDRIECAGTADANHDSRIDALDAALVLQHAAGLIVLPTPASTADDVPTPGPFDFSMSGGSAEMPEGLVSYNTNASITLKHEAGLKEFVTLTQQSEPPGPTIAFVDPDAMPPGFADGCTPTCLLGVHLGWSGGGGAQPGVYSITVSGTAGDVVRTSKFTITVPDDPDFP